MPTEEKTSFEDILAREGRLIYKTRGVSMKPMLRQNRDIIVVEAKKPGSRLSALDVALYRRGDSYVLHRVIEVTDTGYLIRGDNTYALEKVPEEAVLGRLVSFVRNGREHAVTDTGYRLYSSLWNALYPARQLAVRGVRFLKRKIKGAR